MDAPLHPNLARIAAAYDDVQARASRGELSAPAARAEVMRLVARDDEGVLWSIDASTGRWMRRQIDGSLVEDRPPTYGVATPTAHDLTRRPTGVFNPDSRLVFADVDEGMMMGPDRLRGATRRQLPGLDGPSARPRSFVNAFRLVILVAAVLALAAAAFIA